ncbi:MFS transporter [Gordonia sp. ABSL1-1]|uniref:MFS transporter n=1 Tax=Gordonia sp. ABSL1-1 TaxID=3053923 RepID=UPI002572BF59|nr:MFS transporter [Gordonia sp. ABSL1-1]MDL9937049.1 MFS transporter [Gordonia sp. ABSL1-1]
MLNLLFLALAAGAFALAQTAVVPGLGELTVKLNASPADIGWVLTAYLISAAILTPVFGRLGDMFGNKRMLVIAVGLFGAGSIVAALAPNVWVLVAARVIQGAGGGIFPLCFGIIGHTFPAEKRSTALGLISALAGIGAGGGLVMGGLLIDHTSWHWIFWAGALMSGVALAGVWRIPEAHIPTPGRIDVLGVVLLAVGLTMPLFALSKGATWGWGDPLTIGLIVGGFVVLAGFGAYELRVAEPLIDVRTLGRSAVLITNIAALLFGAGMFAVFSLIPQLAQTAEKYGHGFGLDATGSGLLLLPGSLAMLIAAVIAGRVVTRIHPAIPLVAGGLVAALGLGLLAIDHGSQWTVMAFSVIVFIGIGLGMSTMPNLIMGAVPTDKISESTGVNALVRSVGSSIGSQVAATVLASSLIAGTKVSTDSAYDQVFWMGAVATLFAGVVAIGLLLRSKRAPVTEEPVDDLADDRDGEPAAPVAMAK